jgi:hypothetical protein
MSVTPETQTCQICGAPRRPALGVPASMVDPGVVQVIQDEHPDWSADGFICFADLNRCRNQYILKVLEEDRDRLDAENDYRVNLKAELEIRHLNSKLDMLLTQMWQGLTEVQSVQVDLMEQLEGTDGRRRR